MTNIYGLFNRVAGFLFRPSPIENLSVGQYHPHLAVSAKWIRDTAILLG